VRVGGVKALPPSNALPQSKRYSCFVDDLDKKTAEAHAHISVNTNLMELLSVIFFVTTGRATQSNTTAINFNG
jgi:hypothetical protein